MKATDITKDMQITEHNFEEVLSYAQAGKSMAQLVLGEYYYKKEEYEEAVKWFSMAAKQNNDEALNRLGDCFGNGKGVIEDNEKSFFFYLKAAKRRNRVAQNTVGLCFEKGRGVTQDESKAFKWYRKAAKNGLAEAQFNLALCYGNGRGTAKDEARAFEWYLKAAENGYAGAQYNLALCYGNGSGTAKDEARAFEWYLKASENGLAEAQFNLALCYGNGRGTAKDEARAFEWYLKASENGLAEAQHNLGCCYGNGFGTAKDEARAFEWYLKAAENGYAEAQNNLGWCYRNGFGTAKDEARAFEWYVKAAENGCAGAQFNLAWCYENGFGTAKDEARAFEWYLKAAENGLSYAQVCVAKYYLDGKNGIGVDKSKAREWIDRSFSAEDSVTDYLLGRLYLTHFHDFRSAEQYLLKASEDVDLTDSFNWLAVACFAQKKDFEGFEWAKKSADLEIPLGCFIISSAYYNGKGVEKDTFMGDSFYKKAIDNGFSISPEEAVDLDPITSLKSIDFDKLYEDRNYLSSLLSSEMFPKTDFILAKMQKKINGKEGQLTAESIKGSTTRALQNILGIRPLAIEEMVKRKMKKEGKYISSEDSLVIGDMLIPEYYSKKLETLDYTKTDEPSKYMDYQVRFARSSMNDHWDNSKYKDIKKVFDSEDPSVKNMDAFKSEAYLKRILKEMFPERGDKAIDNLYLDVKEENLRRLSSSVSLSPYNEDDRQMELKDEVTPSAEEVFIQKEEHNAMVAALKRFVEGFDVVLRKGMSRDTASVFMVRLLVPSPAKENWAYMQKIGLAPVAQWMRSISGGLSIDEVKETLSGTEFFSSNIDWFYDEQIAGKRYLNNEEISERLGIAAASFTRTCNKTLIPKLIDYWTSNREYFETYNDYN